jgi:diguanylate cyclase (GGDEF)-like protein
VSSAVLSRAAAALAGSQVLVAWLMPRAEGGQHVLLALSVATFLGTACVVGLLGRQRRSALAELARLGGQDPLTGLATRRRWDAELAAVCATARELGGPVSLVLLDLDRLSQVNDRHGHSGGDEALRAVAALLRAHVPAGDLVARLGGDELAVLLPRADGARAVALAETLRRETERAAPGGFAPGELTVSVGVATARDGEAFPLELIARADQQLYRAKITRNTVAAAGTATGPLVPAPRAPG